jgi:hypothetical protein
MSVGTANEKQTFRNTVEGDDQLHGTGHWEVSYRHQTILLMLAKLIRNGTNAVVLVQRKYCFFDSTYCLKLIKIVCVL